MFQESPPAEKRNSSTGNSGAAVYCVLQSHVVAVASQCSQFRASLSIHNNTKLIARGILRHRLKQFVTTLREAIRTVVFLHTENRTKIFPYNHGAVDGHDCQTI
ncbi:MAG: hypothetical protein WBZ36_15940 [Candidatus Nitrosopolaris sp.]